MATDLLNTYKYGWKTSYYQNTMDGKTEDVVKDENSAMNEYIPPMMSSPSDEGEEDCEACAI
jgi:ribonucleoside-diphosphate reductase alpha chain